MLYRGAGAKRSEGGIFCGYNGVRDTTVQRHRDNGLVIDWKACQAGSLRLREFIKQWEHAMDTTRIGKVESYVPHFFGVGHTAIDVYTPSHICGHQVHH